MKYIFELNQGKLGTSIPLLDNQLHSV